MNAVFGMPGPDGSLGMCALCGESFLPEIILGKRVKSINVSGVSQELFAHDKCIKKVGKGQFDVTSLPQGSPLRQAYERQQKPADTNISPQLPQEKP